MNNNWPTSEAGRLKFVIDLYFDYTITEEEKINLLATVDSKYLLFYSYLERQFPKSSKELKINLTIDKQYLLIY